MRIAEEETPVPLESRSVSRQPVLLRSDFALRSVAAMASLGAGVIHAGQIEAHLAKWLPSGTFFIVLAALQVLVAPVCLVLRSPHADRGIIVLSIGAVATRFVSRTVGVPFGPAAGIPEAIAVSDLVATTFEIVTVASLALTYAPMHRLQTVDHRKPYPMVSRQP